MKPILFSILAINAILYADNGIIVDKDIPKTGVTVTLTARQISKMKDPKYGNEMAYVVEPVLAFHPPLIVGAGTFENPYMELKQMVPYVVPNNSLGIVDNNCYFICRNLGYLTCDPDKSMMSKRPCVVGKEWGFDYDFASQRWTGNRCSSEWRVWASVTCVN